MIIKEKKKNILIKNPPNPGTQRLKYVRNIVVSAPLKDVKYIYALKQNQTLPSLSIVH